MPILVILYLALPFVQVALFLQGQFDPGLADALNYAASILCFQWMIANVALSAKVPVLQRALPYDARIRFHIISTLGIVVTLIYHTTYKLLIGKNFDPITWALLIVFGVMLAVALLWIPVPGFARFRGWLLARFRHGVSPSYDRSKTIHAAAILALSGLTLLHILDAELFDKVPLASTLLYCVSFFGALILYGLSLIGAFRLRATVLGVTEKQGVVTLNLRPDRPPRYRSGQFAFLRLPGKAGGREEHPFSFLSIPGDGQVSFAIRASGDFTRSLKDLKIGSTVSINGGYGNFRPRSEPALCFVASGIGTVPFISILKDLHARRDARTMHFHLAVDHEDEIPERAALLEMAADMPNLTLRLLVFSQDGIRYGRDYFQAALPEPENFSYYVCSSPSVRNVVVESLRAIGVRGSAIRYEAFALG